MCSESTPKDEIPVKDGPSGQTSAEHWYRTGYRVGRQETAREAWPHGFAPGSGERAELGMWAAGFQAGYAHGYADGQEGMMEDAVKRAYDAGHLDGYRQGWSDGEAGRTFGYRADEAKDRYEQAYYKGRQVSTDTQARAVDSKAETQSSSSK